LVGFGNRCCTRTRPSASSIMHILVSSQSGIVSLSCVACHKIYEPAWGKFCRDCFTSPNNKQLPAEFFQFAFVRRITLNILLKFLPPKLHMGRWCGCHFASGMAMPKAPTHLYDGSVFCHNNVRMSRQGFDMKTESETITMQKRPHKHFRLRVF